MDIQKLSNLRFGGVRVFHVRDAPQPMSKPDGTAPGKVTAGGLAAGWKGAAAPHAHGLPSYVRENLTANYDEMALGVLGDVLIDMAAELFSAGIVAASADTVGELCAPVIHGVVGRLPILIYGDRGVGKESLARYYYFKSGRKIEKYIPVNCAAFTDTLLDSELFGHEKGSFSGAVSKKKGIFEAANGGGVFLDEIASISKSAQSKLLRFLQDGEFRAVGGNENKKSDVYVICATNTDLWRLVEQGEFRADLYDRLAGVVVRVPDLPQRDVRDKRALVTHFILATIADNRNRFKESAAPEVVIPNDLWDLLISIPYSGNIRELQTRCRHIAGMDIMQRYYLKVQDAKRKIESGKNQLAQDAAAILEDENLDPGAFCVEDILGFNNADDSAEGLENIWKLEMLKLFLKELIPETKKRILGLGRRESLPPDFWKHEIEILIGTLLPHLCDEFTLSAQRFNEQIQEETNIEEVGLRHEAKNAGFSDLLFSNNYSSAVKQLKDRFNEAWIKHVVSIHPGDTNKSLAEKYNTHEKNIGQLKKLYLHG
jgi:transcriptional regulator with AAA-type ATPase domain